MNNEVYVILDCDAGEIIYASKNFSDVQEVYYDTYMESLYYEFLWNVNYNGMMASDAYTDAKEILDDWYRNYVVIRKAPLDSDES